MCVPPPPALSRATKAPQQLNSAAEQLCGRCATSAAAAVLTRLHQLQLRLRQGLQQGERRVKPGNTGVRGRPRSPTVEGAAHRTPHTAHRSLLRQQLRELRDSAPERADDAQPDPHQIL
ncbi:hypothetical protein NDU88_007943 [Pleurodeles waltl]|uniref:Uncharacterized protein n=1 Tax=Pleurodeles waltl TaxID=8319 RepID=A0AAV7VU30_PLEWA|nr:hypothetical protein NDU88_007943 [Pleurodeles waltl]